ncbi:oxidoreductase [Cryobacterium melibiosiphilum]|uniref:Oxidoreductase n=1 Tax=Cryobacterium melibiosiphilum TaxID=995039 RepID=A0A3A5MEP0_9MICO|nr:PDR/VanB family oxidoreductase [Cryobacterium melibiosiphilum]RJT88617.1 oxidoreductase [Cryobacterium melibiosiphilum]
MSAVLAGEAPATHPLAPPIPNALGLTLSRIDDLTPQIRAFTFRSPHGAVLPEFVPGSHILVRCGELTNAYSLTGTGVHPLEYTISVLRLPDGAGGSLTLHALKPGDTVQVSPPRSAFAPVATAKHHLLVAAGIGITPMLSHLAAAREWNRSVSVLYSYRASAGAHLDAVRALSAPHLVESTTRDDFRRTLEQHLRSQPVGTHLYICGPQGYTDAVLLAAAEAGWPDKRVHFELFGAAALDPGDPFTVTLARSGRTLPVAAGQSLLEALEAAGTAVPNLCRRGICGECALPVVAGKPLHRDLYLSPEDKAANDTIMCCVSRGHANELELDL